MSMSDASPDELRHGLDEVIRKVIAEGIAGPTRGMVTSWVLIVGEEEFDSAEDPPVTIVTSAAQSRWTTLGLLSDGRDCLRGYREDTEETEDP